MSWIRSSLDSMNVISEVMNYFAASGSESLKASIRTWAPKEPQNTDMIISRKLWAILQSKTKILCTPGIATRVIGAAVCDLDSENWGDADGEWEYDDTPSKDSEPLSHIDIDIDNCDDEFDFSPAVSQSIPFASDSGYGDSDSLAPEVGANLFVDFEDDLNEDDVLDTDFEMDFEENYVNGSNGMAVCFGAQSIYSAEVIDVLEDHCGFGDTKGDDDELIGGFLDGDDHDSAMLFDNLEGGFIEDDREDEEDDFLDMVSDLDMSW
ncbi:hypothetical protein Cpir12675_000065 [Ceratocystis pirilliformis]|uniref:Uncharacterized protein n=1 Tax=Ceratocystis pirilliformis TaxID=259994 RepID=A0ABR3ZP26_9PEZI